MVGLGFLPGELQNSVAYAVSGDGSVIAGRSTGRAFIWDTQNGMRDLMEVLVNDYALELGGSSSLVSAYDISDDGLTIVGSGFHNGQGQGWIAHLPEPTTLVLVFVGGFAVLRPGGKGGRPVSA